MLVMHFRIFKRQVFTVCSTVLLPITLLPTGRSGKLFVAELSQLFDAYYPGSSLEGVALKTAMSFPILVLQKPFSKSKSSDHILCIERRLKSWLSSDFTCTTGGGSFYSMWINMSLYL